MKISTQTLFGDEHTEATCPLTEHHDSSDEDSLFSAGNALHKNASEHSPYHFFNDSVDDSHAVYEGEEDVTYMVPMPKMGKTKDRSLSPVTVMVVDNIGTRPSKLLLKVLLDPGSTKTMISKRCIPKDAVTKTLSDVKPIRTLAGTMTMVVVDC